MQKMKKHNIKNKKNPSTCREIHIYTHKYILLLNWLFKSAYLLILPGCAVPTQPLSHSPSSTGQGKKIRQQSSWVDKDREITYPQLSQAKQT